VKLFKFEKPNEPIFYFQTKEQIEIPEVYLDKPLKGLWVSNVLNIDMPTILDLETYEKKVDEIFATAKAYQINTLFFQVRTTNDAFYQSDLNPTSRYFVGQEGAKQPYDILKMIIEKAKAAQIEFHAWMNPYRVSVKAEGDKETYLKTCDAKNFAKKHPEWTVTDTRGQFILNPARPEVKDFIVATIEEFLGRYDVDGIHFDDYFYPYGGLIEEDSDLAEFEARQDQTQTLPEFRRAQVTEVIERVYKTVKKINPQLQFGVSPFGIWRNKSDANHGSNTDPRCSESYNNEYADSYHWVKKGIIDYIVPQVYWEFGHHLAPFADIVRFWVDAVKGTNVNLYIGHGAYRLGNEGDFGNPLEIVNQLKYVSQFPEVNGHVFFTYHTFIDEGKTRPGMDELKKLLSSEAKS